MVSLTRVERTSDLELVATRSFNAPARVLFEAWTRPDQIMRWWTPDSFGISFLSCETEARTGGSYRYVFAHPELDQPMAFFGRYIEVTPPLRLVWTNEEDQDGAVTTVTFEENSGATAVVVHDLYPSKTALDDAIASGSTGAWPEQFAQLADLIAKPGAP